MKPVLLFSDGLTDCEDAECCSDATCQDHAMCATAPDPDEVLLRRQPPSISGTLLTFCKRSFSNPFIVY